MDLINRNVLLKNNIMVIQKLIQNEDGTYYAVLKYKTADGYNVTIDVPKCTFEDVSIYSGLVVKSIEEQPLFEMVVCEDENENRFATM